MDILYFNEHQQCRHYLSEVRSLFKVHELPAHHRIIIDSKGLYAFVFMLKGEVEINCCYDQTHRLTAGNMYSLNEQYTYTGITLGDTESIILMFENPHIRCDEFSLIKLRKYIPKETHCIEKLPILPQITDYLNGMRFYIVHKMYCAHLQDIKQSEWFFLMRAFFTKEENAQFFHSLIRGNNPFMIMVKQKSREVKTVAELASACNMTERTFRRHFKQYFQIAPKQWLLEQNKQQVELELMKSEDGLKILAPQLGFCSDTQLSNYCRRYFKKTSSEIRKANS